MMEARASEVFRQLNYLTGCVIFFDEFEEFFRDRRNLIKFSTEGVDLESGEGPDSPIHDRTIAAFTTSAMLPRLQDLHDEARCLIFLATNHVEKIDPAIRRFGRFDFMVWVRHPTLERILDFLDHPTKITFERDMDIPTDPIKKTPKDKKHEKEHRDISAAIKEALNDPKVVNKIKKFNEIIVEATLKKKQEDKKSMGSGETNRVEQQVLHFGFVEKALRDVTNEKKMTPELDDGALKKIAVRSLTTSLKRATKSKDYPMIL